jgi:hypothetical protein
MHNIAATKKDTAATPPPNIIGKRADNAAPAELKIEITTPAVRAVAAAVNIPANPDARASAAVAIFSCPSK